MSILKRKAPLKKNKMVPGEWRDPLTGPFRILVASCARCEQLQASSWRSGAIISSQLHVPQSFYDTLAVSGNVLKHIPCQDKPEMLQRLLLLLCFSALAAASRAGCSHRRPLLLLKSTCSKLCTLTPVTRLLGERSTLAPWECELLDHLQIHGADPDREPDAELACRRSWQIQTQYSVHSCLRNLEPCCNGVVQILS